MKDKPSNVSTVTTTLVRKVILIHILILFIRITKHFYAPSANTKQTPIVNLKFILRLNMKEENFNVYPVTLKQNGKAISMTT